MANILLHLLTCFSQFALLSISGYMHTPKSFFISVGLCSYALERTVRRDGEDPSNFAVALETLAVKAFGDMGLNV